MRVGLGKRWDESKLPIILYVCISGFGVVRWCLTLSFPCAHGIRRLDVYCCARGVFCCCCVLQQLAAVCGIKFKTTCNQWSETKYQFGANDSYILLVI